MIQRWEQELFGYYFTAIHRNEKIMRDVDALARKFRPSYAIHIIISFILPRVYIINIPQPYRYDYFKENAPVRIKPTSEYELIHIPVLTLAGISAHTRNTVTNINPLSNPLPLPLFHIQSLPVFILASSPYPILSVATIPATNFKQIESIEATEIRLLYINDITGSMCTWVHVHRLNPVRWKVTDIFTSPEELSIHTKIFDDNQPPLLTNLLNMVS